MTLKNGMLKGIIGALSVLIVFSGILLFMGNGIVANDRKSCDEDIKIKEIHNKDVKDVRQELADKHDEAMNKIDEVKDLVQEVKVAQKDATILLLGEIRKIR